jgi:thiol:disulfide interchange protein DsbD
MWLSRPDRERQDSDWVYYGLCKCSERFRSCYRSELKMINMKTKSHTLVSLLALLTGLFCYTSAAALDPDEVKNYEDVFLISATAPDRSHVEISWDIAAGYYLYNNRFLEFAVQTAGVRIGKPQIPRGEISFDELLGEEVEKYHGRLTVTLPLQSVAPSLAGLLLKVKSQGCLENVLCYPPTEQVVLVELPAVQLPAPGFEASENLLSTPTPAQDDLLTPDPGLDSGLLNQSSDPLANLGLTNSSDQALDAEAAFVYEAIGLSSETVLVRFTAQAGYYLYRDKFEFRVADDSGFTVREVSLPDGVIKDDPEFGNVPVIYGQVEIPVRLTRPSGPATSISLQADFQGCRDGDICYPPQSRTVSLEMPAAAVAMGAPAKEQQSSEPRSVSLDKPAPVTPPVSEQDRLARLLTQNVGKAILAFFVAGLLLAFTPCVFPMVPILSGIIMGQGESLTTIRAFWLSLVYVLAMAVTYTFAGVLAGLFGQNLQAVFQNPWILSVFVLIFIALALSMFGFFELALPSRLQTRLADASNKQQGGQLWGVAVMGFLSALIVGPCVAPPLMAALIVIGSSGDAILGGSALFAMSMGMGVPLILFGVSAGKFAPSTGPWMDTVKSVFGVGLLALAIWMLERILPGGIIMLLWGMLAIASGVYLGALERIAEGASGWKSLWKALGVVLLLLGALEIIGSAAGGDYWLRPLQGLSAGASHSASDEQTAFRRIKSLDDLDAAVSQANSQGKGAMLDYYADWCVECLRMERNTFHEPEVQALLGSLQPLQADVTANDEVDQALMREYGIIGPPAILFFDKEGKEMKAWRLVGYFNPEEFSDHLSKVLAAQ